MDVGVAGSPEVNEKRLWRGLRRAGAVSSRSRSRASRRGPRHCWLKPWLAAVAAAVGAPALDAVGAGPGGVFSDLGLPGGGEFLQELAVVGEGGVAFVFQPVHGEGEGHLAVFVVVAVGFAVGGDVGELGAVMRAGGLGLEAGEETLAELFPGVQQAFKGDGAGVGAVVEEDGDGAAFVQADAVGLGGVDGVVGGFGPVGGVARAG